MNNKSKFYLYILFPALLVISIICGLLIDNIAERIARDSEPFDQTMYCVEILSDGTTVPMDSFVLAGEIFNNEESKRCITLQPFTISGMTFSTIYYHDNQPRLNDLYKEFHFARICMAEDSMPTGYGAHFYLSHDLQYCKIESYGRCFIASIHEKFDHNAILEHFDLI